MQANKIWFGDITEKDTYVDFKGNFSANTNNKTKIDIAVDGIFTIYINGELAGFGANADYPNYKYYYSFDISKYLHNNNEIIITVWHLGVDSQTYINSNAFCAFNIYDSNGNILLSSNENIVARKNINYRNGYCKAITYQLGNSFLYDSTINNELEYQSVDNYGTINIKNKKTHNLKLLSRKPFKLIETEKGYIVDLGREYVGFIEIDAEFDYSQKLDIVFGEHVKNGHLIWRIEDKDFSVEYIARKGKNRYINTLRRVAGRYLEIFTKDIKINYLGIRSVIVPLKQNEIRLEDKNLLKIYNTCIHTLKCCMHEHYEDGPWREQALYVLDSRNQMLCGYKVFKSFSYQRENLILMSKGINEFGLLDLCFPSGINFPIPFFSLCYLLAVLEYIKNTNDKTILSKVSDAIYSIIKLFDSKIDENGLIANFPYPFWNFYEWSDGSHHCWETGRKPTDKYEKVYDLILNCAYIIAKKCCDELFNTKTDFIIMKSNIKKAFYNSDRGLYKLSTDSDLYSKVGNAFSILAQIDSSLDNKIIDSILHNHKLIPATLSMSGFVYDALLSKDNRYIQYVIEDIKDKYTKMLNSGATTFWETENGEADFNGVGSLCHGWSALPIYYIWLYNSFNTNRRI